MKKKHFLFTSLTIAAILSANVAQAEEVGTTPTEPEKELVTGEADKNVVLEEPKEEFSGELVEALNAEKPQEEHSLLRSMPENSDPTDNAADEERQGKADSDLLEEPRAEVPKTEGESKTITFGFSNSGTKGAFTELTLKPGETIGGVVPGSDKREYVLGSPNLLTYDEIEDGGTYLRAFYEKDSRRKISLAFDLFSWLGYKLDQKNQDAVRAAIAKLLDEEMVDATRLLGGFELDATQKTLVQSHYDKASLALEKLKNGEDGASALPTFEEDRAFHALRIAGEKGELAVKVKTLLSDQNGSQLTVETSPEDAVASLEVLAHIEPTEVNPSPIARLAGQDFDLYDIKLKDAQGQLVSTLKQNALVKLPVDSGKEVTKVIYLPETGEATELPILKQDKAFVYFETNHFSHYGIVYKTAEPSTPKQPQTQTGMNIEELKKGDYSSVEGIWITENGGHFLVVSEHGLGSATMSYKGMAIGEKRSSAIATWGPDLDSYGNVVNSASYRGPVSISLYVPKGGTYEVWDYRGQNTTVKVATEDLILSGVIGGPTIYKRYISSAVPGTKHFHVTAGDNSAGTLVDSQGRSLSEKLPIFISGQVGDTIDLNAVGGRFGREGKAIYRVTLSNGKDSMTLPDYQSSFVLDETTKGYTEINIVYDTAMPKPKDNDKIGKETQPDKSPEIKKPNQPEKSPETTKPNTLPKSGDGQAYTAEQELIARVWKTVTGGTYPYWVVKSQMNKPIVDVQGSKVYPKVTYFIAEDTKLTNRPYALSHEVTFSDNGDGTVTVYKEPKHWHMSLDETVKYTQTILDTAQVIKLDELSKSETETIVKRATRYEGFSNGSSKNSTPQGQGNGKQTPAPQTDLSTRRNQLLLELDKSPLTKDQKEQLSQKLSLVTNEQDLADVITAFNQLLAQNKPSGNGQLSAPQHNKPKVTEKTVVSSPKASLPSTGDTGKASLLAIGAGLLLASLGLVYHRKRS